MSETTPLSRDPGGVPVDTDSGGMDGKPLNPVCLRPWGKGLRHHFGPPSTAAPVVRPGSVHPRRTTRSVGPPVPVREPLSDDSLGRGRTGLGRESSVSEGGPGEGKEGRGREVLPVPDTRFEVIGFRKSVCGPDVTRQKAKILVREKDPWNSQQ